MSAYIERTAHGYKIGTPYGRHTRNSLLAVRTFCRENGFKPVYVGVA